MSSSRKFSHQGLTNAASGAGYDCKFPIVSHRYLFDVIVVKCQLNSFSRGTQRSAFLFQPVHLIIRIGTPDRGSPAKPRRLILLGRFLGFDPVIHDGSFKNPPFLPTLLEEIAVATGQINLVVAGTLQCREIAFDNRPGVALELDQNVADLVNVSRPHLEDLQTLGDKYIDRAIRQRTVAVRRIWPIGSTKGLFICAIHTATVGIDTVPDRFTIEKLRHAIGMAKAFHINSPAEE